MKKEKSDTNPGKASGKKLSPAKKEKPDSLESFPIVGIGASAGGLEALEQFFINMPDNNGIAFVIVQHLDPHHVRMMPELLQRITKMKVVPVTDRLKVKPNSVYVIPSNKSMSILNGALHLFDLVETHGLRLPIDFFLRSLADDCQENSIGIILSGMGSDGSLGVKAIKEKFGTVLVQDPESAKFDSMPRNAIEAIQVDIVAPAIDLPGKLLSMVKSPMGRNQESELVRDTSSLEKILILIRSHTGNDFSQYKKNTVYRRIERRMTIHQISRINSYVRYLQENPVEIELLFKELLIGVTSFFRDPAVWKYLEGKALPALFAELPQGYMLRAWIPGCSTGEEAYSLAITFKESLRKSNINKKFSIQIFATDLDAGAIDQARKGTYPANIAGDVPEDYLKRFFVKIDDQYRVNAEIREMVVFAPQNVIKDPPFTNLDILVCRNMLIYMDAQLQEKILALFHYSLNSGGILLLGSAETNNGKEDMFTAVDSKLRIYKNFGSMRTDYMNNFPSSFSKMNPKIIKEQTLGKTSDNLQTLTDQLLLQHLMPTSVLVTGQGDILYITGNTDKYLSLSAGKASMNLFSMAREGLRNELSGAFRKAAQNYNKIILRNIKAGTNNDMQTFDLTIQQIESPLALKGMFIIIFTDIAALKQKVQNSKKENTDTDNDSLHGDLKLELQQTREDLQNTREEMQTSQEELKSTNEELQSSNEELQSTNEELITSKEEMQSLNEELHTINAELQGKINDSVRTNNDMNNLLNSSEIATLFLNKEFKIRQFTPSVAKIFKLRKSDIGRIFTDQVSTLNYPDIHSDVIEVLRTLVFIEKDISASDGRWFNIRILPYRTLDDKIDGLVITFIDITKSKMLLNAMQETELMLNSLIQALPGVILGLSSDGTIIEFNPEAEKLFGSKRTDIIGKSYIDIFIPEKLQAKVRTELKNLITSDLPEQFKNIIKNSSGNEIKIEWSAHKLYNKIGTKTGVIVVGKNITNL